MTKPKSNGEFNIFRGMSLYVLVCNALTLSPTCSLSKRELIPVNVAFFNADANNDEYDKKNTTIYIYIPRSSPVAHYKVEFLKIKIISCEARFARLL